MGADGPAMVRRWDVSLNPQGSLHRLLCSLFDAETLLRFLRHHRDTEAIAVEVPTAGISLVDLCGRVVGILFRKGLVESGLFARLVHSFPKRVADIAAVARHWGVDISPQILNLGELGMS